MELRADRTLEFVSEWTGGAGLTLASHKSETVFLIGKKNVKSISLILEGHKIEMKDMVRYFGVLLNRRGLR